MDNDRANSLRDACGDGRYPQDFLRDYEPFECLADNESGETLLVKNKRTGMFYVAKCYRSATAASHLTESEILKKLQHTGLPRFVDEYQNDEMLCVIREYVEGTPLHQWVGQQKPSQHSVLRVAMSLCQLLCYLHGQTPPIIHRDIKPQNLIIGTDGQLWLIDFGISRLFREEGEKDTVCWGTQDFAAPEQYGFSQTDVRSDIYSFGILLGWLLTGETKREQALSQIVDWKLKRIVEKCTAFAPRERYASAAKVCSDLAALDGRNRRKWALRCLAAAGCALCLCVGFAIGRFTEVFTPGVSGVTFAEPLIEQAVRLMLEKEKNEPISPADLLSITELYIYGNTPTANAAEYHTLSERRAEGNAVINGGITSLSDLRLMPNLSIVVLSLQNIADLTPLAELPVLRQLDLRHNPLTDTAPLAGLLQLHGVCLYDTRIADLSPFAACPLLDELDIGKTFVTSLAPLEGCASLARLTMFDTPLETLGGIEALERLALIEFSDVADGDLTPLLKLPSLQSAVLGASLQSLADAQLGTAEFIIQYREN